MAINDMMYRFSGNHKKPIETPYVHEGVDEALEALIEETGREKVLSMARAIGWNDGNVPPKWVWIGICNDIKRESEVDAE